MLSGSELVETDTGNNPRSVLVLGEDTRSFLSVIRSLGKAGCRVDVVCYDRTSPALKSKYISSIFYYNHQAYNDKEWLTNVLSLIEKYQYDVVFPCDERAIYPLWLARETISPYTKLAIANQEALDVLFDKWKTKQVARACDVPVAEGELLAIDESDYLQLQARFGDLFVVKPLQSFGKTSLDKRNKVAIIRCRDDFIRFTQSNSRDALYLVEHYFEGFGEGLSVFAWRGKVHSALSYKRLAEPASGGGSSYRKVIETDPDQLRAVELICKKTQLSGLAMFEFRRCEVTRQWILVEVNARAWGGMPLAEYAGVDFPAIYIHYLCNETGIYEPSNPVCGTRARALTADLYEIKRESEQLSQHLGRKEATKHMTKRLFEIGRAVMPQESIDSFRFDDPKPFFSEIKNIGRSVVNPIISNRRYLISLRRWRICREIRAAIALNPNRRFVFVCYGNIIRSPFAESYFTQKMQQHSVLLSLDSFGFHQQELRPSPLIAMIAAESFGCALGDHKSKRLKQSDIRETDFIIYFDEKNRITLDTHYRCNHKICAADLLDDRYPNSNEIADPYESDVKTITACYERICNALDNLVLIFKGGTA
ncbi:arsenate reductase/protein-tyrosine-phosphatase family protein [Vibrio alfacsensis]|uniref:arsenate reductase/protein-tyrosine-phosphatase family protein n=1 Tax=Vibrio alfacsensis TaxID=1074311 RepID=UPI0040675996